MSLLFGSGGKKPKPQFTGLAAQTSTSAIGIPIGFGQNRASPNIIWQNDFKANKKKQKAGKGGPSVTTYTYSGSFIMALGWGPITDVVRVWKDQSKESDFTKLGMSLFLGATPQSPWGYLTSTHPDEALGYPGIAYLAVANYDLGQSNALPQHSFEVQWPLMGTQIGGNGDADPALVVEEFLTNPSYGVGFDFSVFNQETVFSGPNATTTGDAAYQTYCRAMSFGLSPLISNQESAGDSLSRWAQLTNTAIVWNGYELKLRPYGSDTVTGNGVTYLPDFSIQYTLTDADFLREEDADPIKFDRVDPADAKNGFDIVISNRENEYNDLPVSWRDQGLVDQYGFRKADSMDAKEICEPAMGAVVVSLIGQRQAYIRNKFMFNLGPQYSLLEPMDIVECVDPALGTFTVLITEFEEEDEGTYKVVAEEYHGSVTNPASLSVQTVTNTPVNTSVDPGPVNPPVIFEAPRSLTSSEATTPEIWIAVSGGNGTVENPNWGGCFVWASTDDITYNQIGNIDTPARMGKLTANLAAFGSPNPDNTNTLSVSLDMSGGILEDATAIDAAAFLTLCYIDGEFLSYQNVTETGEFDFNLTTLYRALYGSTGAAHVIGDNFVRLDETVFKYPVPAQYIGQTIYLKFQSYNQFGGGVQDLASCTAYPFTVSGSAFGTGTGGAPVAPTGLSRTNGAGFVRLNWTRNPENDWVERYLIFRATGASEPFGSATQIDSVAGNVSSYTDVSGIPGQAYTYFVVASNAVGNGPNSAGVNGNSSPSTPVNISLVYPFGENIGTYPIDLPVTFPIAIADDFAGSNADVRVNPSSTAVFTVSKNGVSVGTISINTSGVATFSTTGAGVDLGAGDTLSITPPEPADSTLEGVTFSIAALKAIS